MIFKINRCLLAVAIASSLSACGGGSDNKAPEFSSDYSYTLDEDTSVSDSVVASDANNSDTLTYTVASAASNGVFALESNGAFTYTPAADFAGGDSVTVQVSDGKATATATVTFTVININDAPVLQTSSVVVSSQGSSSGTLGVTDADGDTITFSVVTQPASGNLELDAATGAFTYTPASLEQIDQNFTVSFTDGIIAAPVEATIDLQPAFTTNADKLNYYFASDYSHLKSAEALLETSSDEEAQDEVTAEIAKGYYIADFEDKGAELVATIGQNDIRGEALRSIARALDSANKTALANTLRTEAESAFNQYLAEKGLTNISSSDAAFYQLLMNDYIDAGESELAENLLTSINIFANAIKEEEYSTAYGRFVVAAYSQVRDRVATYLSTFSDEDREKAEFAIDNMATMAEGIGWRESGGFPAYRTRSFYLSYVADYYYIIQAYDKSKDYAAKTLALFTDVSYDAEYTYEANEYAQATYDSSLTPVETVAGVLEGLYPDLATNPALAIIDPEDGDYEDALEEVFAYQVVNGLLEGATVAEASQAAYDYFVTEKDDLRAYYEILVDENLGDRAGKTAIKLISLQENTLAVTVLNYAFDNVLNTQAYVEENAGLSTDRYITGDWGCWRVISLLDSLGEDVSSKQAACKTLVDTYLSTEAGLVSTSVAREAYKNLIPSFAVTDDTDGMLAAAVSSGQETALLTDDGIAQLNGYLEIATALASFGNISPAEDYLASALSAVTKLLNEQTLTEDLIDDIVSELANLAVSDDGEVSSSGYAIYPVESALRRQAGMNDDYATVVPAQLATLKATITEVTNQSLLLSTNELQGVIESLIELNANAGMYDAATALVNNDVNEEADVIDYIVTLSEIIATQDDFPASDIAFIDTDTDGMPNFFLLSATEAQITASGLTADSDSDGDGIADEEDTAPLSGE